MISPEYTLFNSIPFHEPFFDRVPGEDYSVALQTTSQSSQLSVSGKDMFTQTQDSFTDSFPPHYPTFRRMSADTQASSADSASPDHKPIANDKMASLVLPPIHDLPRPLSPQTSDASSTRSPQWQQQQAPQQHQQQHQQQQQQQQQYSSQHYAPPPGPYNFPPIDQHRARPQLHINPSADYRTQTHSHGQAASYPTPTTANGNGNGHGHGHGHTTSSSTGSNYSSSAYAPYPMRRPEDHYRQVPPPPPGPPTVVSPATLATVVGLQQRRRGKLPKPVTEFLKKWLLAHTDHPYPTEDEKKWLCSETGLSMSQVSNWMINARRRILAPAAKANAAAAAAAASANAAVTSSATATAATPYYSRSPPVRTVSGSTSSTDYHANGSHYSAVRRESSYAPYPMPASRVTNTHQPQHQYSSPATSYPSSAPPYPASSGFPFQSPTPVPAGHAQGPNSAPPLPPALAPYASSTLAPFGDSHEPNHGTERSKSPAADFAYAPQ